MPYGHLVFWQDSVAEYFVLFGTPLPTLTCRISFEAWTGHSRNPRERLQFPKKAAFRYPFHIVIAPWEIPGRQYLRFGVQPIQNLVVIVTYCGCRCPEKLRVKVASNSKFGETETVTPDAVEGRRKNNCCVIALIAPPQGTIGASASAYQTSPRLDESL